MLLPTSNLGVPKGLQKQREPLFGLSSAGLSASSRQAQCQMPPEGVGPEFKKFMVQKGWKLFKSV